MVLIATERYRVEESVRSSMDTLKPCKIQETVWSRRILSSILQVETFVAARLGQASKSDLQNKVLTSLNTSLSALVMAQNLPINSGLRSNRAETKYRSSSQLVEMESFTKLLLAFEAQPFLLVRSHSVLVTIVALHMGFRGRTSTKPSMFSSTVLTEVVERGGWKVSLHRPLTAIQVPHRIIGMERQKRKDEPYVGCSWNRMLELLQR